MGLAFLALNGVHIEASDDELVDLIVGIAAGQRTKADVAVFLQSHARL